MSHVGKGYDINQTFIIESAVDAEPIFSACTALYTTNILSCSGNTSIFLGNGVINFDGSLYTNNDLSATTINASTYYSGGTNLFDIISDLQIVGGTFNSNTDTLTLDKQNGGQVIVTGFTDYYTTGATLIGNTAYFDRNDQLSAYTLNLSSFSSDTYVTGVTFSDNQLIIARNDGVDLNTFINTFTGLTVNGFLQVNSISANTISATTFYGDGSNISGINFSQLATTAHTHPISDVINLQNNLDSKIDKPANPFLGDYLYYNGVTWVPNQVNIPVSAGAGIVLFLSITGSSLPTYEYLSQFPVEINETQEPVVVNNNQVLIGKYATEQLGRTVVDPGIWEFKTYASVDIPSTGLTKIIVNTYLLTTGGSETFLFSAATENITTTAATVYTISVVEPQYSCNTTDYLVVNYSASTTNNFNTTVTLYHGGTLNYSHIHTPFVTLHNDLAGIQGGLSNEHYHLSKNEVDLLTTGLDASSIHNHDSLYLGLGGGTVSGATNFTNGLTTTTFSATTYQNLPTDIRVTGGTKSGSIITFTNNTGGTFTVTGITDTFVTGGTYNSGTSIITFVNNTGGTFTVTGITSGGGGTTSPISVVNTSSLFSSGLSNTGLNASGVTNSIFLGASAGYLATGASNSNFFGFEAGREATNASQSNFIGLGAGQGATGASQSNFLGTNAGNAATSASQSNFLGPGAGLGAINASYSNFFGQTAGYLATGASNSNFFGRTAGYQATSATRSNFLGWIAGYQATNANDSNFLGYYAGFQATSASYSNFFGQSAGYQATSASNSNFLGSTAGYQATNASQSNFLGVSAGNAATGASQSNFFGSSTGYQAINASHSNFFGSQAGYSATSASNSNFLGQSAGYEATSASNSNFLGVNAGYQATNAINSNFLGYQAGYSATSASYSNLFGFRAGRSFTGNNLGSNNIIIGTNITLPNGTANAINIGGVLFGINTYSTFVGNPLTATTANGRIGIGVVSPSAKLHVSGDTLINGTLTATTISASTYQNLPTDIRVTGGTYNSGTSIITFTNNTGGTFTVTGITAGGGGGGVSGDYLPLSGGTVTGGARFTSGLTGNTGVFSSSTQNVLNVVGSGSTSPIFRVQGSQGELFAVTDSLTGSLFSVNDISGLPIMEVFSDNTILMGSYFAPSLNTTYRLIVNSGSTNLYSIPVSAYTGAFYDYTVSDASNARAGNIMAIFSGTSVQYTETSTLDIGSTTGVTFSVAISSGNAVLRVSATTNNWSVKTIIRSI